MLLLLGQALDPQPETLCAVSESPSSSGRFCLKDWEKYSWQASHLSTLLWQGISYFISIPV